MTDPSRATLIVRLLHTSTFQSARPRNRRHRRFALDAPRGTYTGWSLLKPGMGSPDLCGQFGQFIPFAATEAERRAAGDPRPSLEERYPTAEAAP